MNLTIYQLNRDSEEGAKMLFMDATFFNRKNVAIASDLYKKVYSGPMLPGETLDDIYNRFNIDHPVGFRGHSLSVSDVVVIHDGDTNRAYFVDSIGFMPVPDFFKEPVLTQQKLPEDVWAVAVGYNFGFIPKKELEGIALKHAGAVRFEGENWNLFKAETYEGSRKVDPLLDKHGEYPINDYKIEPVMMSGELEIELPGIDSTSDALYFGGYSFLCNGKEIPVDFSGIAWDVEQEGDKLFISFVTGKTPLSTDRFLDDCYEDEYKSLGLRLNDITAEFLSNTHAISEFMVIADVNGKEYEPEAIAKAGSFTIKSLRFDNGVKEFPVRPEVLEEFNQKLASIKDRVMENDTITVLMVEPGRAPYEKAIDPGLKSLQHEVGGCIEVIYPFKESVAVICNEEGKLDGLPLNRALRDEDGDIYDIVAGNFMIAGLGEEDFCSLTKEQMQLFAERFKTPEEFVRFGNKIVALESVKKPLTEQISNAVSKKDASVSLHDKKDMEPER